MQSVTRLSTILATLAAMILPCASLSGPKREWPVGSKIIGYEQSQVVSCKGEIFTIGGAMEYTQEDTLPLMRVESFRPEVPGWHEYPGLKVSSLGEWKRTKIIAAEGIVYASTWFPQGSCRLRYLDLETNLWIDLKASPDGRIPDSTYRAAAVGGTIHFFLGPPWYWSGSKGTVVSFDIHRNTWSQPWVWNAAQGVFSRKAPGSKL